MMDYKLRFIRSGEDKKAGIAFILNSKKGVLRIKLSLVDFALALMAGTSVSCTVEKVYVDPKELKKGKKK